MTVHAPGTATNSLYEVLQVAPGAGQEVIQAAYRALAPRFHPDLNEGPEAARAMRQLNAAYRVLSDPGRRARYDAFLARRAPGRGMRHVAGPDPRRVSRRPTRHLSTAGRRAPILPDRVAATRVAILILVVVIVAALLAMWVVSNALDDGNPYAAGPAEAAQLILNRS